MTLQLQIGDPLQRKGRAMLVVEGSGPSVFGGLHRRQQRVVQGSVRARFSRALIGPNGSGKSTIFNMLSGTFPPSAGFDQVRWRAELSGARPAQDHQSRRRPHLFRYPAGPFVACRIFEKRGHLAGYYGQDRHSEAKAFDLRRAARRSAIVGLSTDRKALVDGLGARGALKKLELAKGLGHRAQAAAGRREPGRPRRQGDGSGRRHAAPHSRRARHHHHLGSSTSWAC